MTRRPISDLSDSRMGWSGGTKGSMMVKSAMTASRASARPGVSAVGAQQHGRVQAAQLAQARS